IGPPQRGHLIAVLLASLAAFVPVHHKPKRHHRCHTQRCHRLVDANWGRRHGWHPKRLLGGARSASDGQWVIPTAIVMCESGGANLPPNGASAAGYYQILGSTWAENGGTSPDQANLHSKAEQDAVAARIWAGGAGASQWVW